MERGATEATRQKHHLHAYFYWNDGIGIDLDNTSTLAFDDVRPRVDVRVAQRSFMAAKIAAYHGLWYVTILKLGTVRADTNFEPW